MSAGVVCVGATSTDVSAVADEEAAVAIAAAARAAVASAVAGTGSAPKGFHVSGYWDGRWHALDVQGDMLMRLLESRPAFVHVHVGRRSFAAPAALRP